MADLRLVGEPAHHALELAHLLAVLRGAVKLCDEIGSDVDARIIEAHAAQLARGREWPGDVISPATTDPEHRTRVNAHAP